MEKNEYMKVRRALTQQITEIKTLLSADKKKEEDKKLGPDYISQVEITLETLIESREKLKQSYNRARIERINNQGRKMAEEILIREGDEVKLTPKIRGKLTSMANRTYSLENFSPRLKKSTKTKRKNNNNLFD